MTLLLKSDAARAEEWTRLLADKAPELPFRIWPDIGDPAEIRYLAAWLPPDDLLGQFPNLELLVSVGAGVDQLNLAEIPARLPIVRMIEPGLVDSMVEYVTMSVLALHRDLVPYIAAQREQAWRPLRIRPTSERRVGVLGLGMLGKACALKLAEFGFGVAGWSRSRHEVEGIETFAGDAELPAFLARTDILVCLLPLTDATRGLLGAELFARLPLGRCWSMPAAAAISIRTPCWPLWTATILRARCWMSASRNRCRKGIRSGPIPRSCSPRISPAAHARRRHSTSSSRTCGATRRVNPLSA
jgi:glyoxylate/hydroxypyruvate reductase A